MGQLPRWAAHARWCLSAGGDFAARAAGGAPGARRLRPRCLRWAEAVSHARRAGRAAGAVRIEEQTLRGAEAMRRHPITDRDHDRATLREVAQIVTVAVTVAAVIWWVWYR